MVIRRLLCVSLIWPPTHREEEKTMKTAVSSNGKPLVAAPGAPAQAICPKCGGLVTLRVRKLMANSGTSSYWRHEDDDHPCQRQKPFMRVRPAV